MINFRLLPVYLFLGGTLASLMLSGCEPSQQSTQRIEPMELRPVPYDLKDPKETFKLKDELEEVSGLSYLGPGRLAMVQDEKGNIYAFDLEEEEVVEEYDFGSDGDYEDIEMVGDTAYVLRSDGDIYRVVPYSTDDPEVEKYETALSDDNDTEGLAYWAADRLLLIACKHKAALPGQRGYGASVRAIYAFSLERKQLIRAPFLLIDTRQIQASLNEHPYEQFSKDLARALNEGKDVYFQPSGIAVHPLNNHLYVIASVGKMLLEFDRQRKLVGMSELDKDVFKQPEGICFLPNGDLFISNEGRGGKGNVLWFPYQAPGEE